MLGVSLLSALYILTSNDRLSRSASNGSDYRIATIY